MLACMCMCMCRAMTGLSTDLSQGLEQASQLFVNYSVGRYKAVAQLHSVSAARQRAVATVHGRRICARYSHMVSTSTT